MKQGVLILGASQDQLFMIRTAREMGLFTAVVDANPAAPGFGEADFAAPIDFSDVPAVIAWCQSLIEGGAGLGGVCTMGSDVPHIVSGIASHFGWEGPSAETARLATHKYHMKLRFAEAGIPVPRFGLVSSAEEIRSLWKGWNCGKMVIKPTDRAGSKGVRIITAPSEASSALEYARGFSKNGEILLEEFVQGPQISTESILFDDFAATPGFADRMYEGMECFHPLVMENGGWLPSSLTPELIGEVCSLAERAARALGLSRGVAKGDIVICPQRGPMVIEMAARLSGGDFSESLVPLSSGVNYVRTALEIAVRRDPDFAPLKPTPCRVIANRYLFPPPGRLEQVDGYEQCRNLPGIVKFDLYPSPGALLPVIDSHGARAGVFVVSGASREEVQSTIDFVYETVRFKIDGRWCQVRPESGFQG
jgi:biotin carboxylase